MEHLSGEPLLTRLAEEECFTVVPNGTTYKTPTLYSG